MRSLDDRLEEIDNNIAKSLSLLVKSKAQIRKHQRAHEIRRKRLQELQELKLRTIRTHREIHEL